MCSTEGEVRAYLPAAEELDAMGGTAIADKLEDETLQVRTSRHLAASMAFSRPFHGLLAPSHTLALEAGHAVTGAQPAQAGDDL